MAKHAEGLLHKEIAYYGEVSKGGLLTEHLKNLESAGFIFSFVPFNKAGNSKHIKYILSDAYMRFYFTFILPNKMKIINKTISNFFSHIIQTGAFYSWMGKSFEYFCICHARIIAKILGFSGIDYSFGPYYKPSGKSDGRKGVQIDLLFDRKDHVISLCEMKYSKKPVGINIIAEIEKKEELLKKIAGRKTIQKVLITMSSPTNKLINSCYFYHIIQIEDFFKYKLS